MSNSKRQDVITFKVDRALSEALEGISNRSEFIRSAILAALGNTCPLCRGTGILSEEQQGHWEEFSRTHIVERCDDCHAFHLVCTASGQNGRV